MFRVSFKYANTIFDEFGDTQREIWTTETLAARLLDKHYHIESAIGRIVIDAGEIAKAEQIERTVKGE